MAYVPQEFKAKVAPGVKALCKQYGVSGTLSVRSFSTLACTLSKGSIDFISNFNDCNPEYPQRDSIDVNPYHYRRQFAGRALEFLTKLEALLKGPDYYDRSDSQTDYFDTSHYIAINVGRWDKPYKVI